MAAIIALLALVIAASAVANGGDVAMYFAKQHPELISKVITLDNLFPLSSATS
jgi:hypothetical protein